MADKRNFADMADMADTGMWQIRRIWGCDGYGDVGDLGNAGDKGYRVLVIWGSYSDKFKFDTEKEKRSIHFDMWRILFQKSRLSAQRAGGK